MNFLSDVTQLWHEAFGFYSESQVVELYIPQALDISQAFHKIGHTALQNKLHSMVFHLILTLGASHLRNVKTGSGTKSAGFS